METYNKIELNYTNPNEGSMTTSVFEVGTMLKVSGSEDFTGVITKIFKDEEEAYDNCYPNTINLECITSSGIKTINWNPYPADEVDPQWFINYNFYEDNNNSIQVMSNSISVDLA